MSNKDLERLPSAPGYSAEPEPVPGSALRASIPSAEYERDLARRLHAAAIAKGKAEAILERTPRDGQPVAFRMMALSKAALAHIKWLRIYLEAFQYFQDQEDAASGIAARSDETARPAQPEGQEPGAATADATPSPEKTHD